MRYLVRLLIGLALLLLAALLVVSLLRIPVNLERYEPLAESLLSDALGRSVDIDGRMMVTTSLWPYFELDGLRIANPPGFPDGDIARMEHARVTIGLLPLLQGRVAIREFRVRGLRLDLVRTVEGEANWVLEPSTSSGLEPGDPNEAPGETAGPGSDFLALDELELEDILVRFHDGDQKALEFQLHDATGGAPLGEPMSLQMGGVLLDEPFALELKADSLSDFLQMTRTRLGIGLDIAETRLEFVGLSEALRGGRGTELALSVTGADLSSLNGLLRLDLPPISAYRLEGRLRHEPGRLELKSLDAAVKDSSVQGNMVIDWRGPKPAATLDLHSSHLQLADFDVGDWSPQPGPEEAQGDTGVDADTHASGTGSERAELLSPEALTRADGRMTLRVKEVFSGEDRLGSAELGLSLRDGRIDVDPLHLQLPQSSLRMVASLKPDHRASDASLRLVIDGFDFGVLSRLSDPESQAGGSIDLDIDIVAAASRTSEILSGADGYLDVVAKLDNVRSGLVDLWAVNLLSAVVSSTIKDDQASQVNCLLGRFRLKNGLMSAEQVAVDTSRIRICGQGHINFASQSFDLVATPRAKRPEFFSLATPVAIRGEFDDFRIGVKKGVLTLGTTATKFAVSPITTPLRRIFRADLPRDGADVCGLPIGPREGPLEPAPGC